MPITKMTTSSHPRASVRTGIEAPSAPPVLDDAYRQVVGAAAGADHLRKMTERCLARADALVSKAAGRAPAARSLRRDLHRLAGATAAVGLSSLAATLRALEQAYERPRAPELLSGLWEQCRAAALAARAALSAEGS